MRNNLSKLRSVVLLALTGFIIINSYSSANAQPGLSFSISHDALPYQEFDKPVIDSISGTDTTYYSNPEVKLSKVKASLSYPLIFSEGRTVFVNELSYQLVEFEFRNMTSEIEQAHAASYTLMLQHQLSKKWTLMAMASPSIASDLEAEVSSDDFSFQAVAIFIRQYSERLSIGYGAAYSTQFGSAIPLPVLALDWNNGSNMMIKAILTK